MGRMTCWFEDAGTCTGLAVSRLPRLAEAAGVQVEWRSFLLAPILKHQVGMERGPSLGHAPKLEHMWRDLERRAAVHGVPYRKPSVYPPNTPTSTIGDELFWGDDRLEDALAFAVARAPGSAASPAP
jgi:2-hydroxychromene-2-carboxylate isomerase